MTAKARYDAVWLEIHRGDLTAALKLVDDAVDRFPDVKSDWHWRLWALKGEVLMLQGHHEEALSFLALPVPGNLAESDVAVRRKLTQGAACARLRRFDEAAKYLHEAKALAENGHPELLDEYELREGTLHFHLGEIGEARDSYSKALQLSRDGKDQYLEAAALGSLALASTDLEHYDEAIDWNGRALRLSHTIGDIRSVSRIEGNTGWNYREVGDYSNALTQFENAEKDADRAGITADRGYWLNSAAGVHYDLGEYAAAQSAAQGAIAISRALGDDAATIECLQNLALVAIAKNDFKGAKDYSEEAIALEGATPLHRRELYSRLILAGLQAKLGKVSAAEASYKRILADRECPTSVRWEAQAGLAQIHVAMRNARMAEREFAESIRTIRNARNAVAHEDFRLSFLSSAIRFYDAYVNFLVHQKRPIEALRVADLSRAQTLGEEQSPGESGGAARSAPVDPRAVARRLNATLLFYWMGRQGSYLWLITPSRLVELPLTHSETVDGMLSAYRQSFLEPRDPAEAGNANGEKLYDVLIKPAEKLIPKNSRVIVIPDGNLNSLNFETLIVARPAPHYWIEDVTVTSANSLGLLARATLSTPPKDGRLLLVGDAQLANPDFPPLPQAEKEIRLVEQYFDPAKRAELLKSNATATRYFTSSPENFDFLHFTTHGTASRSQPLESAVILSPEGDSYKLYARDILRHPLSAYLVTISACNGAGLRTYAGEGLVGLSWAFLRAGAHNVIGGLWEVSNASTPSLMDELYRGIHDGDDPATALRNAKLTLVHSKGNYRKPFYWAPFVLYSGS